MKILERLKDWWDRKCPIISVEVEYWPLVESKSWARQKARERRKRIKRPFVIAAAQLTTKGCKPNCYWGKELDRLIAETVKNGK